MGPRPLQDNFWQDRQAKIGVLVMNPAAPRAMRTGDQRLLDLAINELANNSLESHLTKLRVDDHEKFCTDFIEGLVSKGMNVQRVSLPLDVNSLSEFEAPLDGSCETKDYRPYIQEAGVDKLIILSLPAMGTTRPYYGFVPLGPPKAICMFGGKMIEAKTNKLLWSYFYTSILAIPGNWDNPPQFPEVTARVFEAVNISRESVKKSFFGPSVAKAIP
ncbi:MAG: hypothetical protein HY910_10580 [Desulfarculus sp.]|nr:hypothetical protein [Desulfarculus sp.]